jgi:hypothetical protein
VSSDTEPDTLAAEDRSRAPNRPTNTAPADPDFDWRGWLLVGAIVLAFLVIPGAIIGLPGAQAQVAALGLSLRDAYLVLPLLPAFLLGGLAVWSALAARRPDE